MRGKESRGTATGPGPRVTEGAGACLVHQQHPHQAPGAIGPVQAGFLSPRACSEDRDVVPEEMDGIDGTCSVFIAAVRRGKETAQVCSKIPG